ncbi:MAG: hypothetical protein JWM95_4256, partial [Gemmatimonadetes bacterium]|nr:hypothetical protein [Gemmatimonadota bacterium]
MQRFRAAAATVALVSRDRSAIHDVDSILADDTTKVDVHATFESLVDSLAVSAADIVIIDDRIEHDALEQIRLLRRRQPLLHIVYMNVRDEWRSIELLHWGADDPITLASPIFVARLQSATRRARTMNAGARIAIGDIVFDR